MPPKAAATAPPTEQDDERNWSSSEEEVDPAAADGQGHHRVKLWFALDLLPKDAKMDLQGAEYNRTAFKEARRPDSTKDSKDRKFQILWLAPEIAQDFVLEKRDQEKPSPTVPAVDLATAMAEVIKFKGTTKLRIIAYHYPKQDVNQVYVTVHRKTKSMWGRYKVKDGHTYQFTLQEWKTFVQQQPTPIPGWLEKLEDLLHRRTKTAYKRVATVLDLHEFPTYPKVEATRDDAPEDDAPEDEVLETEVPDEEA